MKKSNIRSWVAGVAILPVCFITACGQDKTLDQYNHDKAQQDLAKVQAVSGTYNGVLLSNADNAMIGPMSVELVGRPQISSGTNQGSTSVQQATLTGTITLSGAQQTSVEFVQGFYDSDNGTFQVDVPITLQNGTPATVDLAGSFDGNGAMNGTLKILGFTSNGGYFSLGKGAALPQVTPAAAIARDQTVVNAGLTYQGTATRNQVTTNVVMAFTPGITTRDQDFANRFNPIKYITVNITYGGNGGVVFPNTQWDQRTGLLKGVLEGQNPDNTKSEQVLICNQSNPDATKTNWNCQYQVSNGTTLFNYSFVLTPVGGGHS